MVALPGATAVRTGGLSVERVTMVVSLEVQVSPVTGWFTELTAWKEREFPTAMFRTLGTRIIAVPETPVGGTTNWTALLHVRFCSTFATPVTALFPTVATTVRSLHELTAA